MQYQEIRQNSVKTAKSDKAATNRNKGKETYSSVYNSVFIQQIRIMLMITCAWIFF